MMSACTWLDGDTTEDHSKKVVASNNKSSQEDVHSFFKLVLYQREEIVKFNNVHQEISLC